MLLIHLGTMLPYSWKTDAFSWFLFYKQTLLISSLFFLLFYFYLFFFLRNTFSAQVVPQTNNNNNNNDSLPINRVEIKTIENNSDRKISTNIDKLNESVYSLNKYLELSKDVNEMSKDKMVKEDIMKKLSLKDQWLKDQSTGFGSNKNLSGSVSSNLDVGTEKTISDTVGVDRTTPNENGNGTTAKQNLISNDFDKNIDKNLIEPICEDKSNELTKTNINEDIIEGGADELNFLDQLADNNEISEEDIKRLSIELDSEERLERLLKDRAKLKKTLQQIQQKSFSDTFNSIRSQIATPKVSTSVSSKNLNKYFPNKSLSLDVDMTTRKGRRDSNPRDADLTKYFPNQKHGGLVKQNSLNLDEGSNHAAHSHALHRKLSYDALDKYAPNTKAPKFSYVKPPPKKNILASQLPKSKIPISVGQAGQTTGMTSSSARESKKLDLLDQLLDGANDLSEYDATFEKLVSPYEVKKHKRNKDRSHKTSDSKKSKQEDGKQPKKQVRKRVIKVAFSEECLSENDMKSFEIVQDDDLCFGDHLPILNYSELYTERNNTPEDVSDKINKIYESTAVVPQEVMVEHKKHRKSRRKSIEIPEDNKKSVSHSAREILIPAHKVESLNDDLETKMLMNMSTESPKKIVTPKTVPVEAPIIPKEKDVVLPDVVNDSQTDFHTSILKVRSGSISYSIDFTQPSTDGDYDNLNPVLQTNILNNMENDNNHTTHNEKKEEMIAPPKSQSPSTPPTKPARKLKSQPVLEQNSSSPHVEHTISNGTVNSNTSVETKIHKEALENEKILVNSSASRTSLNQELNQPVAVLSTTGRPLDINQYKDYMEDEEPKNITCYLKKRLEERRKLYANGNSASLDDSKSHPEVNLLEYERVTRKPPKSPEPRRRKLSVDSKMNGNGRNPLNELEASGMVCNDYSRRKSSGNATDAATEELLKRSQALHERKQDFMQEKLNGSNPYLKSIYERGSRTSLYDNYNETTTPVVASPSSGEYATSLSRKSSTSSKKGPKLSKYFRRSPSIPKEESNKKSHSNTKDSCTIC